VKNIFFLLILLCGISYGDTTTTLTDRATGETITQDFFNDIHAALDGAFVGRNSSGVPTTGQSLGTSTYRWALSATTGDFNSTVTLPSGSISSTAWSYGTSTFGGSGIASFSGTTASTSNTTGTLLTAGGIASSNTTDASSSTNGGSGTFAGGLAVAKKLFAGLSATVGTGVTSGNVFTIGGTSAQTAGSDAVKMVVSSTGTNRATIGTTHNTTFEWRIGSSTTGGDLVTGDTAGDLDITTNSKNINFSVDNGSTRNSYFDTTGNLVINTGIRIKFSTANTSNPPTNAELVSTFGAAATVGSAFAAIVDDNNGHTNEYFVWSDGTKYLYLTGTAAP
jgi:hypothetical protein